MRWSILLVVTTVFSSTAAATPVGVFTDTVGDVQILRTRDYLAAAPGVEVTPEDIVETGKASSAQLDMDDGSVLKLGPETRVVLSDYNIDANKNVASAALDVLSGWVRFAVAKLKPEGRYQIHTPTLTIGIRGTEGIIEAQNDQGGLHLSEGAVDVAPVGTDAIGHPPMRVNGGEYIQRVRGQALAKHAQPPTAFQNRLPSTLQQPLARRAHQLRQRGVSPRHIRQMTREDARRYLERHPHMNQNLRRRFGSPQIGAPGPHPILPKNRGEAAGTSGNDRRAQTNAVMAQRRARRLPEQQDNDDAPRPRPPNPASAPHRPAQQ